MVKLPAGLRRQTATFIGMAVMHSQRVIGVGEFPKHKLSSFDNRRPDIRADDIDAEREEAVALGGDEPPSIIPPLRAKEPGRAKNGPLKQPAVLI